MDAPVSQGRVLLGKYRVERVIGKGAMGVVLAARHIQLDDRVAIKLLLQEVMAEEGVVDRFLQEARAVRRIKSEHVAQVTDVGLLESGTPYIIMEYLEGRDLAKVRSDRGTLDVEEVVEYVLQACVALAEAHSQGIIHRDLKPANLFLTRRTDGAPLVKVLDFGTSKVTPKEAQKGDLEMTKTGMAIGSPSYMAPEQMLSSRNIDQTADIWALGIILYNLLTGTFPFKAETLLQMCAAVIQLPPVPLTKYRPEIPAGLEAVILKCLEKKPTGRWADVAELARALLPFAPPQSRLSVERIERILGVTSDLATFLAPSTRRPDVERIEVDMPAALLPPAFTARPAERPDAALITKSLSTSSLATVVRNTDDSPTMNSSTMQPAPKRSRKAVALGTAAALALAAALLFTFRSPLASDSATAAAAAPATAPQGPITGPRAVEVATPVMMKNAFPQPEPVEPPPPVAQEPVAIDPTAVNPALPVNGANGPNNLPRSGRGAPLATTQPGQAQAGAVTQAPPVAAPPPPVKQREPAVVIPDDR